MTEVRLDLMELNQEALMALANPGFVKRALKDLAEGRSPQITVRADQAIVALYEDGHTAVLALGQTLRDASCTCPASNLCRHRVTLIPAYQYWVRTQSEAIATEPAEISEAAAEVATAAPLATPDEDWSPADFSDDQIEAAFRKGILKQATALAKNRPAIRLVRGRPQSGSAAAYLPMSTVRFFSAHNLAHARCDCLEGSGCAHVVLAIWAFRQAQQREKDFQELIVVLEAEGGRTVNLFDEKAERCVQAAHDLLTQIWSDGLTQPPLALEEKLTLAATMAEGLKWRWISEAVDDLRRSIEAYHARSSRFSGQEFMAALAFLYARLKCAQYIETHSELGANPESPASSVPAAQILGLGVAGEVALEHLTLVGLGTEIWEDARQNGIRCYFVDSDTMTPMVLERGFEKPGEADNAMAGPGASVGSPVGGGLLTKRLAGLSLKKLSRSQIVTRGAKRRANGLVTIAANARLTNALASSGRSWDHLGPPLKWPGAQALKEYLRARPPEFIEPRQALNRLAILPVGAVLSWGWEAGWQRLSAWLSDSPELESPDGEIIPHAAPEPGRYRLELPYRKIEEFAVDNLARHLERGDLAHICGLVKLEAGELCLRPLALTTDKEMIVLATHSPESGETESPAAVRSEAGPEHAAPLAEEPEAEVRLRLESLQYFLQQFLLSGLRHRNPRIQKDLGETGSNLAQLGLPISAGLIEDLENSLHQNDRPAQLSSLSRLTLLLHQLQKESLSPLRPSLKRSATQ